MQYECQSLSLYEVTSLLDEISLICDPEFDAIYEDLDREFAHRRLHLDDHEGGNHA